MSIGPDTIAAISTPSGRGGIGIIRISGPEALPIVQSISKTKTKLLEYRACTSRKLVHAHIIDGNQTILDEVLLAIMPSNRSYTSEPTIEINCHGGRAVIAAILKEVLSNGARLAEPGEFTKRAVESGRIDLIQAEAINDLINARSEKAMKLALKQMEGGLTKRCQAMRLNLVELLSEIQALVDFEVDDRELESNKWFDKINDIIKALGSMIQASQVRKYMDHGVWIVLAGPPNAGKSSIFNAILNIERSIVCDCPGTTRDHISETVEIEGIEVRLTDTAGIRETEDQIESASVDKSLQQVESSDIVIYVVDQSKALEKEDEIRILETNQDKGLLVLNKKDLPMHSSVKRFIDSKPVHTIIAVSALMNEGIEELIDKVAEWITNHMPNQENPIASTIRQAKLLEKALEHITLSLNLIQEGHGIDLVEYELEKTIEALEEIIGKITNDEIFDTIFSKFCIGK